MKGIKIRTFVIFALAALSGAALLHTSQRVQQAEERLAVIQAEIQKEEEMTRVLTAEWEYLNRPERLEALADEFLDLVPPAPDTMPESLSREVRDLPERPLPSQEGEAAIPVSVAPSQSSEFLPIPPEKPQSLRSRKPQKEFNSLMRELGAGGGDAP